jgi:fucose permease
MAATKRGALLLLVLCYAGFVSLGLPDGLLGVAWPSMRRSFGLAIDALGALLVTSTAGYVAASFASGYVLARMRVGGLLALSCLLTSASLVGYALAPSWAMVVTLGTVAGLGAGAIDAGINTHVATHHSARTLSLLHSFYALGTATGPIIMTNVLAAGLPWQRGYALVGAAQLALAAWFGATRGLWTSPRSAARASLAPASVKSTLALRTTQLAVTAFFVYVGIEATAGAWIYSLLEEARGATMAAAGAAVTLYWCGLMVGRLGGALLPVDAKPALVVRLCAAAMTLSATVLALRLGYAADLAAAATLGCACGPIFPSLVAATPRRLGAEHAANAIGVQVAGAAVGQSLLPALVGTLADAHGLETIATALVWLAATFLIVHHFLERTAAAGARASSYDCAACSAATPGAGPRRADLR